MRIFAVAFIACSLLSEILVAQINQFKFFIRFADKNSNPYTLSNPSAFLSARAIQRRVNQGIGYDYRDLPVTPQYISGVATKGSTVWAVSKWFNGASISVPDSATYNAVMALPYVQSVMQVRSPVKGSGLDKFEKLIPGNNSFKNNPPDLTQSFNYGWSYNQIHLMNGEYLHDQGYRGEGMVIAILDAGFYKADQLPAFDSLNAHNQILGTRDFVANELNVYDDDAHGEAVLSCIAGNIPGQLVGTAPAAHFWLLRSEDGASENIIEEYNWATAAEYADSAGADVISTSLGYTTFDSTSSASNHTYADMNGHTCPSSIAANTAASKGILVIASAGNSGYDSWHYIVAPSDADSALSIAAVDSNGYHAGFSSYGPSSDGDVKPNVAAKGLSTTVSYADGSIGPGSGTSFACPVLAGAATCLWQAHPAMKNMQILHAIEQSASYHNNPNDSLGFGIPDFMLADKILNILEDKTQAGGVIVYPNPFNGDIRFIYPTATHGKIFVEIYDELGRVVFSEEKIVDKASAIVLPQTGNLAKGVYFLNVIDGEKTFVNHVVKY